MGSRWPNRNPIALVRRAAILFLFAGIFFISAECGAQGSLAFKIDENISRFAFSSSRRIAFATRHVYSVKKISLQRDDIWIAEADGKRRRILFGEKFVRGTGPFSYAVRGMRWSADSSKLAVELGTSEMINEDGDTREGVMTLLLDDAGREITIAGADGTIPGATNAAWLTDGVSVVYLSEHVQENAVTSSEAASNSTSNPASTSATARAKLAEALAANKLFSMNLVKAFSEGTRGLFEGHLFSVVAWDRKHDTGVGIERDAGGAGSLRLVTLDLAHESLQMLGTIRGYAGGLTISPSGKKLAYWIDNEVLEVRDVDAPNRMARVRVALGTLAWSGDEARVLVKRGAALRSGGLVWLTLPPLASVATGSEAATAEVAPQSILHDLEFRQFEISPDGRFLGVVEPGKRNLLVYAVN